MKKSTHGGARPGAGRPANEIEKTVCRFRLTEDEHEKVKAYISEIRKPSIQAKDYSDDFPVWTQMSERANHKR